MENNKLFKAVERSTQNIPITLGRGNSERWTIQSQKTKYVNGKLSGVIGVGYSASIDNPRYYFLEEDKSNNKIQITAQNDGTSGLCVLTQEESGNKINLHLTTPEYWEIRLNPITINGYDTSAFFDTASNIKGESGSMADGTRYKNWIVNQNRNMINVYISPVYPPEPEYSEMLSWSCLDKDGNAFNPNYRIPDNVYFTIKTTGLGSYTLKKISTPPVNLILSSNFNPTKKYPLDLNFYWDWGV